MRKAYRNRMTGKVSNKRSLAKIDIYDVIMISDTLINLYNWFFGTRKIPTHFEIDGVSYHLTIEFSILKEVLISYNDRTGCSLMYIIREKAPTEKEARKKMYNYLKENGYLA